MLIIFQAEVVRLDKEVHESAKDLTTKSEELIKTRKVQSNICSAIDSLTSCLPVLTTYSKLQSQMQEKRFVSRYYLQRQYELLSLVSSLYERGQLQFI